MSALEMKAEIVQGDDVDIVIDIKDKSNNSIDVSGASAITFKLKSSVEGETKVSKTLSSGIAVNSPATSITVTLTDDDTGELLPGTYYFECQITDGGLVSTVRDFDDKLGEITILADLDS